MALFKIPLLLDCVGTVVVGTIDFQEVNNATLWTDVFGTDGSSCRIHVRHYMCFNCIIPSHYEPQCHIAMYQFQDLATLVNIPQKILCPIGITIGHQTKQWQYTGLLTFLDLESHSTSVNPGGDIGLLDASKV